ncbi:MAG: ABC transporter ATP-binding protein, partial [Clostridiales bacterium]|nr:ABC transporter ATP-binding protein [Clostridiales bacterium]
KEERESKARLLLERFRLKDAGKRPFKAYSKGMRRKLTIAAALIHSPQVLFLDEPTSGIDVESSRQIRKMIIDLKEQGTSIFLTTHYIEEAERICDRLAFIVEGKIVASGSVAELMESISHEHSVRFVANGGIEAFGPELQSRFKGSELTVQADNSLVMTSEERVPLFPIMEFFHEKGIEIYEARELRPSLEDVFVKLTGIESSAMKKEKEKGGRR